jgi:uncharacterized membrane protein YqjE
MEKISSASVAVLTVFFLIAVVLVAWLIYRNYKDEREFEESVNDPKKDFEHHHPADKT